MADPVEQKARRQQRFEQWARVEYFDDVFFPPCDDNGFMDSEVRDAWQGWRAAERSVVSDIVEKLEKRIADYKSPAKRLFFKKECAELEWLLAELKRDYLGEK